MDPGAVRASYADAEPRPFWLDGAGAPEPAAPLEGEHDADLLVVGGGLTGLWTALLAPRTTPVARVVLLEGERIAFGASGRNGGFLDASLTHGIENGVARWPDEMPELERLGRENFAAIKETIARHGIDAGFEENGELSFATEPYQVEYIAGGGGDRRARSAGQAEALDAEAARAEVNSPTYHGAVAMARRLRAGRPRPARLGPGARRALGRRRAVHEGSPVTEPAHRRRRGGGPHRARAGDARAARCSPPAPSLRSCARSATTWCRSGTTCW